MRQLEQRSRKPATKRRQRGKTGDVDGRSLRQSVQTTFVGFRIRPETRDILDALAERMGKSKGAVLDDALRAYESRNLGEVSRSETAASGSKAADVALNVVMARDPRGLRSSSARQVRETVVALVHADRIADAIEYIDSIAKEKPLLAGIDSSLLADIVQDVMIAGQDHLLKLLVKAAMGSPMEARFKQVLAKVGARKAKAKKR